MIRDEQTQMTSNDFAVVVNLIRVVVAAGQVPSSLFSLLTVTFLCCLEPCMLPSSFQAWRIQ